MISASAVATMNGGGNGSNGHHNPLAFPRTTFSSSSSSLSSCYYNDHSNEQNLLPDGLSDKFLLHFKCGRSGTELPFPVKLHTMLDDITADHPQGLSSIVSWQCHGRSFIVHKQKEFVDIIMKQYFKQTKFPSFQRQLNLYGFKRLTSGKDKGSYYHEFFLRQKRFLSYQIGRVKIKGTKVRQASTPNLEPDFYSMAFLPVASNSNNNNRADAIAATTTTSIVPALAVTKQEVASAAAAPAAASQQAQASTMMLPSPPNPLPPTALTNEGPVNQEILKEEPSSSSPEVMPKAVIDPSPTTTQKMMLPNTTTTTGFVAPTMPLLFPPPPPCYPASTHTTGGWNSELTLPLQQHKTKKRKSVVIDPSSSLSTNNDRIDTTMRGPNGFLIPAATTATNSSELVADSGRLSTSTTFPPQTRMNNRNVVPPQQGGGGGGTADPAIASRPTTTTPAKRTPPSSSGLCMMRPLPSPPLPVPVMESSFLQTKILAGSIQQIFSPCSFTATTSKGMLHQQEPQKRQREDEVIFDPVGSQAVLKKKLFPPIAGTPHISPASYGQQHDVDALMKMTYSPVLKKASSSSSSEEEFSFSSSHNTSSSSSSYPSWWVVPPRPLQQQDQQHQQTAGVGAMPPAVQTPSQPRNLYANEDFDAFDDDILDSLLKASSSTLSPVPTTTATATASETTSTLANIKVPPFAIDNSNDQQKSGATAPGHPLVSFSVDPTYYYHHHHYM